MRFYFVLWLSYSWCREKRIAHQHPKPPPTPVFEVPGVYFLNNVCPMSSRAYWKQKTCNCYIFVKILLCLWRREKTWSINFQSRNLLALGILCKFSVSIMFALRVSEHCGNRKLGGFDFSFFEKIAVFVMYKENPLKDGTDDFFVLWGLSREVFLLTKSLFCCCITPLFV